jgi:hypothetical protein
MLFLGTMVTIAACPIPLEAQSAPAANQPASVSIHISLQKSSYAIGEKPKVVMSIRNISSSQICLPVDTSFMRIHLTSKDGEPPKTEFYRRLLKDFRPGNGPVLMTGPSCRPIASGSSDLQKVDLAAFYNLRVPGNYSVYLEIYDPAGSRDRSGRWLRTNTAKFEIQAGAPS